MVEFFDLLVGDWLREYRRDPREMLWNTDQSWQEFAMLTVALSARSRFLMAVHARGDSDMITDKDEAERAFLNW